MSGPSDNEPPSVEPSADLLFDEGALAVLRRCYVRDIMPDRLVPTRDGTWRLEWDGPINRVWCECGHGFALLTFRDGKRSHEGHMPLRIDPHAIDGALRAAQAFLRQT